MRSAALVALAMACSCEAGPAWVWPVADFADPGIPFDPNTLIDSTASLTDPTSLPLASSVQSFLMQSPYGGSSFLATYASNGVSAAQAITNAASSYQLNPLVILARAEMDAALVSESTYPTPSSRVEYAFGCGCAVAPSPKNPTPTCDPAFAGFDKQVDCFARTLRSYLDSACGPAQATAGGFAKGRASSTLDGVSVTPANEATAALYQYTPLVSQGVAGGNWFFWSLYQKFAQAASYPGAIGQSWVGDPCCGDAACPYAGGTCAVNVPDGMCTAACSASNPCPMDPGRSAVCGSLAGQGFCLFDCAVNPCRTGYVCQTVSIIGGGQGLACLPN
jgi:hypothetical protein